MTATAETAQPVNVPGIQHFSVPLRICGQTIDISAARDRGEECKLIEVPHQYVIVITNSSDILHRFVSASVAVSQFRIVVLVAE